MKCSIPFFSVLYLTFPAQMKWCSQMNHPQKTALGKYKSAPNALMGPRLLSGSPQTQDRSLVPREVSQEAPFQVLYICCNCIFI